LIRQLCDELLVNHDRVTRLKRMLRKHMLPATGQTITTMPGIGTILAATIVGETASVTRFRSRAAYAVYNGTAPARGTGGRERHKARRACNHRLKRAFWLAARAAALHDPLAKAYFNQCKSRGLNYNESIKRIARRMSDIVYSLLKSGRDYDRAIVEQAIQKRQEQVANADHSRVKEALPIPDRETLSHHSHRYN
jgi:transposase